MVETLPSNAVGAGSVPGQRTKNPLALRIKDQKYRAETIWLQLNRDFKSGPH